MRDKERETSVIFVRHGVADYPEDKLYDEKKDPDLSPEGRHQAGELARWLKGQEVAALYVSPQRRTLSTAQAIGQAMGLSPDVSPDLKERNMGVWEGLDFSEVMAHYPTEYQSWKADPVGFRPSGGESITDLATRIHQAVERIITRHGGKTVVMVSHVGPIRAAVAEALEMPLRHYRRLTIPPGSATRMNYGASQNNLIYLGVVPYRASP